MIWSKTKNTPSSPDPLRAVTSLKSCNLSAAPLELVLVLRCVWGSRVFLVISNFVHSNKKTYLTIFFLPICFIWIEFYNDDFYITRDTISRDWSQSRDLLITGFETGSRYVQFTFTSSSTRTELDNKLVKESSFVVTSKLT